MDAFVTTSASTSKGKQPAKVQEEPAVAYELPWSVAIPPPRRVHSSSLYSLGLFRY